MRRALGWLLPVQGPVEFLHPSSPCALSVWLLNAVEAVSCNHPIDGGASIISNPFPGRGRGLATDAASRLLSRRILADTPAACDAAADMACDSTEGPTLPHSAPADAVTHAIQHIHLHDPSSCSQTLTSLPQPSFASSSEMPSPEAQYISLTASPPSSSLSCPPSLLNMVTDRDSAMNPIAPAVAEVIESGGIGSACTAAEPSALLMLVQQVANSYELVHTATGLPWSASIPLTTLVLRLTLLPLSMRQARIIRSNFNLYKEAVALTDQQERERQQQDERQHQGRDASYSDASVRAPLPVGTERGQELQVGSGGAAGTSTAAVAAEAEASAVTSSAAGGLPSVLQARLHRSHAVLANFEMLRRKVDAPHPAWIVVNPLVQIPVFVLVSTTLGMMCRLPWPGLTSEGALWFPDLTQPALVMETGEMPLGPAGMILPLLVYGMTMTSLRLGFGASGLAVKQQLLQPAGTAPTAGIPDTTLAAFLRSLAPLLYVLTTLNLYFKVQMSHGVLVHWLGSAGFTLSLQLALRNPALRALLKLNKPQPPATAAPSIAAPRVERDLAIAVPTVSSPSSSTPLAAAASSSADADDSGASRPIVAPLPSDLVARVAETFDPNILVIMGAQLSARHQYAGALHCFRKAVLLNPSHVRAHYSMGQVSSLTGSWHDAETSYRAAAALSSPGPERGQALYCVATALHSQGKLEEAAEAYQEADTNWQGQAVVAYGRANALAAVGRREEALAALAEAEVRDGASPQRPFRAALARLRAHLNAAASAGSASGGACVEGVGRWKAGSSE